MALRRRLALSLGLTAVWTAWTTARADEQERVFESPRFLGRGDTFVAAYDSDDATKANPAAMADTPVKVQVRYVDLDLLIGQNSLNSLNQVAKIDQNSSAAALVNDFADKFGERQYARAQAAPLALRFGGFEVMPFATTTNWVDLRDPVLPVVDVHSDSMLGLQTSYAFALSKNVSLGINARYYQRTTFEGDVQFSDLLNFVNSSSFTLDQVFPERQSTQLGVDLGLIWQPTPSWRYGLLIENVGYAGNLGTTAGMLGCDPYPQRVDVGMDYRVDWKPWHLDWSADLQDLVNPSHYNYFRLLHLGAELGRPYISRDNDVGLEAGFDEGYLSGGAYLDLFLARLNVSYYAVELGEYPGQRADRRWAVTLDSATTF